MAPGVVALAFVGGTVDEWGEGLGLDLLEDLGSTTVARVGVDQDGGLHVRDTGRDTTDSDEMAEVSTANVADGHRFCACFAGRCERLEVDLVATGEEGGEELRSRLQREGIGAGVHSGDIAVAVAALGEDDVEDVIVVAAISSVFGTGEGAVQLGGGGDPRVIQGLWRDDFVNGSREDLDVVGAILVYRRNQMQRLVGDIAFLKLYEH